MGTKTLQFLFFDTLLSLASHGRQSIMLIKSIANFPLLVSTSILGLSLCTPLTVHFPFQGNIR